MFAGSSREFPGWGNGREILSRSGIESRKGRLTEIEGPFSSSRESLSGSLRNRQGKRSQGFDRTLHLPFPPKENLELRFSRIAHFFVSSVFRNMSRLSRKMAPMVVLSFLASFRILQRISGSIRIEKTRLGWFTVSSRDWILWAFVLRSTIVSGWDLY